MPASRDARLGSPTCRYGNKTGRLRIIATSLTLMLATYDCTLRRSARFHKIAGLHLRDCVSLYDRADRIKDQGISTGICDRAARIADHHLSMVEKYSQASRYPWLPVSSDPPEPE